MLSGFHRIKVPYLSILGASGSSTYCKKIKGGLITLHFEYFYISLGYGERPSGDSANPFLDRGMDYDVVWVPDIKVPYLSILGASGSSTYCKKIKGGLITLHFEYSSHTMFGTFL